MSQSLPLSLVEIEAAAQRLEGIAVRTPVLTSRELDARVGARVFLKAESLQHIGAFKFRGAYNRLAQIPEQQRDNGVVAFSSGNHAQGIALAAQMLSIPATIVMPTDAPRIKLRSTEKLGATIQLYDRHNESREDIAESLAAQSGAVLVPAFDDIDVIAGQGTCGLELMHQIADLGAVPEYLLSPVGGGGLLSGVSIAVHNLHPGVQIYGVEPDSFDDHLRSRQTGKRVRIDGNKPTMCDSLMATSPGEITWSVTGELVTDFLTVTEEEVAHAISFAFRYLKLVVEPGGAVALAALLNNKLPGKGVGKGEGKEESVAAILSGGNIDPELFCQCLTDHPSP